MPKRMPIEIIQSHVIHYQPCEYCTNTGALCLSAESGIVWNLTLFRGQKALFRLSFVLYTSHSLLSFVAISSTLQTSANFFICRSLLLHFCRVQRGGSQNIKIHVRHLGLRTNRNCTIIKNELSFHMFHLAFTKSKHMAQFVG